jgi:hypothetical protein
MVSLWRMRSYTGLVFFFLSYTTTSVVTRHSLLLDYWKNFKLTSLLHLVGEVPIWCMPRVWPLPSQVGEMHAMVFLFHGAYGHHMIHYLVRLWWLCHWNDAQQNGCCIWFLISICYLIFATRVVALHHVLLLKEGFTLLRKAPNILGSNSSAVISLSVLFSNLPTRPFW